MRSRVEKERDIAKAVRMEAADVAEDLFALDSARIAARERCPLTAPVLVIDGEAVSLRHPDGRVICPFYGCRWHLALDVNNRTGSIKHNFPDLDGDPRALPACCVWDMVNEQMSLSDTGRAFNIVRDRVRQVVDCALGKLRRAGPITTSERPEPWQWRGDPGLSAEDLAGGS